MYICMLVRCHLHPIWLLLLPINLTYILIFFHHCPEWTCPIRTSNIPSTKFLIHFLPLGSFIQKIRSGRGLLVIFCNKLIFYGEDLLVPWPTPKLKDYPLTASRDCLFNIFTDTLHTWRLTPASATWGSAMPWWQGTHRTWPELSMEY
jgi:hypothetical protein